MKSLLSLLEPTLPQVACLFESQAAMALRVSSSGKEVVPLVRHEEPIPAMDDESFASPRVLGPLADSLLVRLGSPKRLSLVLEDPFFKMQVLTLNDFPRSEQERSQVILWHVRKFLNYAVEGVRMRYRILRRTSGAVTLFVVICPEESIALLESAFEERGCHVGYVGSSTLELYNLALTKDALQPEENALLINRGGGYVSLLFLEKGLPLFFRCRDFSSYDGEEETDRVAQELRLTLAYYTDKLGGGPLDRVLLRSWPEETPMWLGEVAEGDTRIEVLEESLPPLDSGQERGAAFLPLYGLVEGRS